VNPPTQKNAPQISVALGSPKKNTALKKTPMRQVLEAMYLGRTNISPQGIVNEDPNPLTADRRGLLFKWR